MKRSVPIAGCIDAWGTPILAEYRPMVTDPGQKSAISNPFLAVPGSSAGLAKGIIGLVLMLLTTLLSFILYSNVTISDFDRYTFDTPDNLPKVRCAIVLGTSKWLGKGRENRYYKNRIIAAHSLYKAGKCTKIIVSGDNRTVSYNEPKSMKEDLVRMGVNEEDIICDYAELRTLDSIIRFKEVFGQSQGIVVSQKFHNSRAIYVARANDIELYGFNAVDVDRYNGLKTKLREIASKFVCFLDVHVLHTGPRHLGPEITI